MLRPKTESVSVTSEYHDPEPIGYSTCYLFRAEADGQSDLKPDGAVVHERGS